MNTYQITGVYYPPTSSERRTANEWINAKTLEGARAQFFLVHPGPGWIITGEELIGTDIPEETAGDEEERCSDCQVKKDPDIEKLIQMMNELEDLDGMEEYPLVSQNEAARLRERAAKLEEELEEQWYQRAEAERKLAEARRELAKMQEETEVQQIRADTAEEEVIRLKAKLYDYMTELE